MSKNTSPRKRLENIAKSAKPYEVLFTWKTTRTDNKLIYFRDNHVFLLLLFKLRQIFQNISLSKRLQVKRRNQIHIQC